VSAVEDMPAGQTSNALNIHDPVHVMARAFFPTAA
jgi:hypothetical protein